MPNEQTNVQSTQQSSPYLPQLGQINDAFGKAGALLDKSGQSDPYFDLAMNSIKGQGADATARTWVGNQFDPNRAPSFLEQAGQGQFVGANPWLNKTFDTAADRVGGQIAGRFAGGGRYGSGAMGATLGRSLDDLATQIYGGAYESDMGRALTAGNAVQQNMQRNAGLQLQQNQDERNRLLLPIQMQQQQNTNQWGDLSNFMRVLTGQNFGQSGSSTAPSFSNPLGSAIGGLGGLASAAYLGSKALPGLSDWFSGLGGGASGAGSVNAGFNLPSYGSGGFTSAAPDLNFGFDTGGATAFDPSQFLGSTGIFGG